MIESQSQKQYDLELFLKNVRKYTEPDELTAEMVNTLIDKIIVHAPDKSSGHRKQKVEIFNIMYIYKYIIILFREQMKDYKKLLIK